jgi:cytoskeletal protein RodZ
MCGIARSGWICGSILGKFMRIALTAALMWVVATAWGQDSSFSETKKEASAEATQAQPAEPAAVTEQATETTEQAEQTEQTAPATATMEEDKPFKIPAGYREKRVGGKVVYCSSRVVSGSRFGKDTCRTEEQLRAVERQKEAARSESKQ